jgi:hypothetical protein
MTITSVGFTLGELISLKLFTVLKQAGLLRCLCERRVP